MGKNYSEELKELINKYKERGFEWGKPVDYLEFRNGCSKQEMEKEILDYANVWSLLKNKKNKEKQDTNCILYIAQKLEGFMY